MDTKQLITIVITAVITAFARQLVEAIVALMKAIAKKLIKHPIAARPQDWKVVNVGMALWMTGANALGLFHFATNQEPIGRIEILMAIFWYSVVIYWGKKLIIDSCEWVYSRRKTEPNQSLQTMIIADTSAAAHPPRQL